MYVIGGNDKFPGNEVFDIANITKLSHNRKGRKLEC